MVVLENLRIYTVSFFISNQAVMQHDYAVWDGKYLCLSAMFDMSAELQNNAVDILRAAITNIDEGGQDPFFSEDGNYKVKYLSEGEIFEKLEFYRKIYDIKSVEDLFTIEWVVQKQKISGAWVVEIASTPNSMLQATAQKLLDSPNFIVEYDGEMIIKVRPMSEGFFYANFGTGEEIKTSQTILEKFLRLAANAVIKNHELSIRFLKTNEELIFSRKIPQWLFGTL